jgi:hypothetical protein
MSPKNQADQETTSVSSGKISSEFPQGYGDFKMRSSDDTIFYFPRGVLAHVSPVFKDMFDIVNEGTPNSQGLMTVTENADTINQFLHHIDPLKNPLKMKKETVIPLLEAARKYQVSKIIKKFEEEACRNILGGEFREAPMLLLHIAEEFGLESVGKFAMSKAVAAHINTIIQGTWSISQRAYSQLMYEREKRSLFLSKSLIGIIQKRIRSLEDEITRPRKSQRPEASNTNISNDACFTCIDRLHNLIIEVVSVTSMEPSMNSLYYGDAFKRSRENCSLCKRNLWSGISPPVTIITETIACGEDVRSLLDDFRGHARLIEQRPIPLDTLSLQ